MSRNWLGPCSRPILSGDPEEPLDRVVLDRAGLLRRLLLFETVILDSYQLGEAPDLVATFGVEGLTTLLRSGCLKIRCEAFSFGVQRHEHQPLPPDTFDLVSVRVAQPKAYTSRCLQNVQDIRSLRMKEGIRLKREFVDVLLRSPPNAGVDAIKGAIGDAQRPEVLRLAIGGVLEARLGRKLSEDDLVCGAESVGDRIVRIDSNLAKLAVGSERLVHEIHEGAVLALLRVNERIEQMQTFNALSGTLADDMALVEGKLTVLARELNPGAEESEFQRVVELHGFPSCEGEKIDAERLLKVRDSNECREFRDWLGTASRLSDEEVLDRTGGVKNQLSSIANTSPGKAIRFLATNGAGFIPGIGIVAGPVLSAIDTFLVDRFLSRSGPAAFVSSKYPSLFRKK